MRLTEDTGEAVQDGATDTYVSNPSAKYLENDIYRTLNGLKPALKEFAIFNFCTLLGLGFIKCQSSQQHSYDRSLILCVI